VKHPKASSYINRENIWGGRLISVRYETLSTNIVLNVINLSDVSMWNRIDGHPGSLAKLVVVGI
jgi:hypothetical protein